MFARARRRREPLRLHPENPHYFLFRGKPTVLVTSGEHYGAVVNLDFKYDVYLDTLASDGLNLTRLFVGSYLEKPGDFKIRFNTLAPAPGRAVTPWARSTTDGYAGGGPSFDLDRWDAAYFARLKDFVAKAEARGIVVEVVLFSNWYGKGTMSPLHPSNNVNGLDAVAPDAVHTLANGALLARQEAMVRKLVAELNAFDNVYFEIQNEPDATSPDTREIPPVARTQAARADQGPHRRVGGMAGDGGGLDRRRGAPAAATTPHRAGVRQ